MNMKATLGVFLTLGIVLAFLEPAEAKIRRSCRAHYELRFELLNGTSQTDKIIAEIGHFYARRGCGRNVPDRCRRRARDAAHLCMAKHWENRTTPRVPTACQTDGVHDYSIGHLEKAIERAAASELQEFNTEVPVRNAAFKVFAVTEGDSGCDKEEELSGRYLWPTQRGHLQLPPSGDTPSFAGNGSSVSVRSSSLWLAPGTLARTIFHHLFFAFDLPTAELGTVENSTVADL